MMTTDDKIDWAQCPLIELKSDVSGDVPVIRGTCVPAKAIVDGFVRGVAVSELSARLNVPRDAIRAVLFFAKGQGLLG